MGRSAWAGPQRGATRGVQRQLTHARAAPRAVGKRAFIAGVADDQARQRRCASAVQREYSQRRRVRALFACADALTPCAAARASVGPSPSSCRRPAARSSSAPGCAMLKAGSGVTPCSPDPRCRAAGAGAWHLREVHGDGQVRQEPRAVRRLPDVVQEGAINSASTNQGRHLPLTMP